MSQPARKDPVPAVHRCPVCQQPQTKIQRCVGGSARGSTIYVCTRVGACSAGMDLAKIGTWVAV